MVMRSCWPPAIASRQEGDPADLPVGKVSATTPAASSDRVNGSRRVCDLTMQTCAQNCGEVGVRDLPRRADEQPLLRPRAPDQLRYVVLAVAELRERWDSETGEQRRQRRGERARPRRRRAQQGGGLLMPLGRGGVREPER